MLRRPVFSQETEYQHRHTPRKWRTFYNTNLFQPSIFRYSQIYRPQSGHDHDWIGKYLVPYRSSPYRSTVAACRQNISACQLVSEYEIMRANGMYSYRIIFVVPVVVMERGQKRVKYIMRSKPAIEARPGQLNIFCEPNMRIVDIQYF